MEKEKRIEGADQKPRMALVKKVLELSEVQDWEEAQHDWVVADVEEDVNCGGVCVCGKSGIRYKFTLLNTKTHKYLFYVGSKCVKYFDNKNLVDVAEAVDDDYTVFNPRGEPTKVQGMKYIDIFNEKRWWLVFQSENWTPSKAKSTALRNRAFTKLLSWYNARKSFLDKRRE